MKQIKIDDIDIKILAELTGINAHTEARLKLAGLLNEKELMKCYEAVNILQNYFGSLPNELGTIRDTLDKSLFSVVEEKCSLNDVKKIKKSF